MDTTPSYEDLVEENKTLRNLIIRLKDEATSTIEALAAELEVLQTAEAHRHRPRRREAPKLSKEDSGQDDQSTIEQKTGSFPFFPPLSANFLPASSFVAFFSALEPNGRTLLLLHPFPFILAPVSRRHRVAKWRL